MIAYFIYETIVSRGKHTSKYRFFQDGWFGFFLVRRIQDKSLAASVNHSESIFENKRIHIRFSLSMNLYRYRQNGPCTFKHPRNPANKDVIIVIHFNIDSSYHNAFLKDCTCYLKARHIFLRLEVQNNLIFTWFSFNFGSCDQAIEQVFLRPKRDNHNALCFLQILFLKSFSNLNVQPNVTKIVHNRVKNLLSLALLTKNTNTHLLHIFTLMSHRGRQTQLIPTHFNIHTSFVQALRSRVLFKPFLCRQLI